MEFYREINVFHASANPTHLFVTVQGASAPDMIDLAMLADNLENKQLTWLTRKNAVLSEIREALASVEQPGACGTTIVSLLGEFDELN